MSDGDVRKFSAADSEDESLTDNVVQKKLHEYYQSI